MTLFTIALMNDDIKELLMHVTPVALLPKEVSERPALAVGGIFLFFIFPFQMKSKFLLFMRIPIPNNESFLSTQLVGV
jgi:hypothetical protein